jgi:hypothetical protein
VRSGWYEDDESGNAAAEEFARREDRPGRSVFDAVNLFRDDATARNEKTVEAIRCIHVDVDLKDLTNPKEDVVKQALSLEFLPSRIVDSGHGLHIYWLLKEPIEVTDPEAEDIRVLRTQYTERLGGDPQVNHDAALMRRPGTTNTKVLTSPVLCAVIWEGGKFHAAL